MANKIDEVNDISAESGIIATLIYHPEYILHSDHLKPGYFSDKINASVYWAIQELYKEGIDTIDEFNLTTKLNSNNGIKKIIEKFNISTIADIVKYANCVSRETIEEYKMVVNRVVSLSFKRELYNKIQQYGSMCLDEKNDDLGKLQNNIFDGFNKLVAQYILTNDIELFGEKVDELWRQIEEKRNSNGVYGIPLPYSSVNEYFTLENGELFLIKARMKKGKSALMLNIAVHLLKNNVPTVYLDTEMSSELFFLRILANLTGIEITRIKYNNYSESEAQIIDDAKAWLKKQPFVHIYEPSWSLDKIYSTCKILQYKMGMQVLIFDYLKENKGTANEIYNGLGEKTDFLKNKIAGEFNIPVITATQLNRNGETADSDKIERYCSVSFSWKEKSPEEIQMDGVKCGNYKINVNLNRIGDQMMEDEYIDFIFKGNTMTICEALQHEQEDTPF